MKKPAFFTFFLLLYNLAFSSNLLPVFPIKNFSFIENEKQVYFILPNSCSGLIGELIEGNSTVSIFVEGKLKNGRAIVQVKMEYSGTAKSTLQKLAYDFSGKINTIAYVPLSNGPVNIPIKDYFKLAGKHVPDLYLADLGYITAYPDGRIESHILSNASNTENDHPNIYCKKPNKD